MPSIATKGPSLHHPKSVKASSVGDTDAVVGGVLRTRQRRRVFEVLTQKSRTEIWREPLYGMRHLPASDFETAFHTL
jgi:hypothetical protein